MKQKISVEQYKRQQAECDGLCDVTEVVVDESNLMRCVTCPFCKEIVSAILTEKTIACPECKVVVPRS